MKLLVVSNFHDLPSEHYLLNLLFCEGLEAFHLRKKNYSEKRMREYIERIPAYFHNRIIIHSHYSLIREYGLYGAHFTKKYTLPEYYRETDPLSAEQPFERIGFSYHSISEVIEEGNIYNYIFLSPIFDSISNKGYNSKFRFNDLKHFLQQTSDRPEVIALGGINDARAEMAFNLGFDGIALLGYLWTNFELDQDLIQAVEKFKLLQKMICEMKVNGEETKQQPSM
ncbi:MAG: thiamine phosphate synthase [Bacteroidota bacterium]